MSNDDTFNVLGAMQEEPTYDNLVYIRFSDLRFDDSHGPLVYQLEQDMYVNFSCEYNKLELVLKQKRGANKFIAWLMKVQPEMEILFSNFYRDTMSIKFKIEDVQQNEFNKDYFKITLFSEYKIRIKYSKTEDESEYIFLVEE